MTTTWRSLLPRSTPPCRALRVTVSDALFIAISGLITILPCRLSISEETQTLIDHFFLPHTAHIELEVYPPLPMDGVNVKSVDDVMSLHSSLSAASLTEASVKSWDFLRQAGISPGEVYFPPLPAGAKSARLTPEWSAVVVDLDGSSSRQDTTSTTVGKRSTIRTKYADVVVSKPTKTHQITHSMPGSSKALTYDPWWLFSRSDDWFRKEWNCITTASDRRYQRNIFSGEVYMIADKTQDSILARVYQRNGSVAYFALHLAPHTYTEPRAFSLPSVVCVFTPEPQRGIDKVALPRRRWQMVCCLIKTVEFDVKVEPQRFDVPASVGEVYVARGPDGVKADVVRVARPVSDIAHMSPTRGFDSVSAPVRSSRISSRNLGVAGAATLCLIAVVARTLYRYRHPSNRSATHGSTS